MRHRWIAAPVAVALLLAACGGDDASSTEPSAAPTVAATDPSSTEAVDDAYPVTIAHKYGETTIESRPERIVLVGLTEQDALLALGVTPVAVSEWFGGYDHGIWPWAQPFLGDAKPEVLAFGDAPPYERITALKPDLILGLYSGLYEEEYATLSAIAPTVAQPGEYSDFGIPWQEETLTIGRIVGERARAEQLVAEVEAKFAEVRAANPEFAGKTAVMATPYEGIWVYSPEDPRGRFLTSLGFEMPADLTDLVVAEDFGFDLSLERVDLLDLDLLVWIDAEEAEREQFAGLVYETLPVHTEGRDVYLDSESEDPLGGATTFVTVLSLPYLLDGLVPKLAAAIDGDPATSTAD